MRRPFASACPPCRSTLLLRTHTIRVTLRLRQCAAIAVCRLPPSKTPASSAQPAIAASDALAQPQEGHAQANAAGVRPSPVAAADGVAGFGSGLPGIPARQPLLSRRRRTVTPKVSPQPPSRARCSASPSRKPGCRRRVRHEANALLMRPEDGSHRRHPVTTFPHAVFAALTRFKISPRRAFFHLRRRAGPLRLRLRWGRRCAAPWKDSTSPDNTTTNHRHLTQDRQDHRPDANPTAPRSLRAQRSRHRQSAVSRPLLCAPFTRKRASRIFRRQPNEGGGCRSKNVLTGTVSQSEGRPL